MTNVQYLKAVDIQHIFQKCLNLYEISHILPDGMKINVQYLKAADIQHIFQC